jgi:hypothetical protein
MVVSRSRNALLMCALVAIHLAITLPLAYLVNIWADEASSLYTSGPGIVAAVQGAIANERQAPLYFAILAAWRTADQSIFFARFLSIVFSTGAIILFANLTFGSFAKRTAIAISCFFALHPFLIWASTEIRVYSLVLLLSIALINQFEKTFPEGFNAENALTFKGQLSFVAFAVISLYTNYYLGFLLPGFLFVLVLRREWKRVPRYIFLMAVVAILCLPLLYIIASQVSMNTVGFQQDRPVLDGVRFIWHHILTFLLPAEIFPDEVSSFAALARLEIVRIALIGLAVVAALRWRRISMRTCSYAVITFVIAGLFLTSYLIVGENYVAIRHASVLFVPLILLFASGSSDVITTDLARPFLRWAFAAMAAIVVGTFFAYSIFTLYPDLKKRGDWEQVAAFVQSNEKAGDAILVFTTYDALAFKAYYMGPERVLPDKNYFDFELEDKFGSPNSMNRRIEFAISEIPKASERLWLVESEKCITTDACAPLENYVQANYTVTDQKDFYRERVRLLTRKIQ